MITNKYDKIIELVFFKYFEPDISRIKFHRQDITLLCKENDIPIVKNLGDLIYSFRFRKELPESIQKMAPDGLSWVILGAGQSVYEFRLCNTDKIYLTSGDNCIEIPDSSPGVFKNFVKSNDEQACLKKTSYNNLISLFTGTQSHSLQSHLRTNVKEIGQIEIDEIYSGLSRDGSYYIMPCQAKKEGDSFGLSQIMQDSIYCAIEYPDTICRPIGIMACRNGDIEIVEFSIDFEHEIINFDIIDRVKVSLV